MSPNNNIYKNIYKNIGVAARVNVRQQGPLFYSSGLNAFLKSRQKEFGQNYFL